MAIDRRALRKSAAALALLVVAACAEKTPAAVSEPSVPDPALLYQERFTDVGRWPKVQGAACAYERDKTGLLVRNVAEEGSCELVLDAPVFDFPVKITLQARRLRGPFDGDFGLIFSVSEGEKRQYYSYTIRVDGAYVLARYDGQWRLLPGWQSSARLYLGNVVNEIAVVLDGKEIVYFANGERLGSLAEMPPPGQVGLFLGEPGLEVRFEEIRIERVEISSTAPSAPPVDSSPEEPKGPVDPPPSP